MSTESLRSVSIGFRVSVPIVRSHLKYLQNSDHTVRYQGIVYRIRTGAPPTFFRAYDEMKASGTALCYYYEGYISLTNRLPEVDALAN
jgi:hypothetical protein